MDDAKRSVPSQPVSLAARRMDRRSFLRLSGAVSFVTFAGGASAFLAACSNAASPAATAANTAATIAPSVAATAAPTSAPTAAPSASAAPSATAAPSASAAASVAPSAAPPSAAATTQNFGGATLNIIALDGEDGKKELEAWRTANNVQFAITPNSGWDATFAKLKTDQFDIALVANPFVTQWAKAGVLTPIDTSRLSNWNDMFPALRDGDFLKSDGKVYAVPIAWGDGPYVYNPDALKSPPKSIMDLVAPTWTSKIVMTDDATLLFHCLAWGLGFDPNTMTKAQLSQVSTTAKTVLKNVVAFASGYQDETDYLVRGEADLALSGWEAMLSFAKDKGKTLKFDFFTEAHGGGWCDSWAIPTSAKNVDAAYAAIDAMISPAVNAVVATDLISGTVNAKAINAVDPSAKIYDYSIVQSTAGIKFEDWNPPLTAATPDSATKDDWDAAWKDIRAGV